MKVLTVSNMGPKPSAPLLGIFVSNQVNKLTKQGLDVEYFNMSWNGDSLIHKLFKYPWFFISFVLSYAFSRDKYDVVHIHYYYPTILCAYFYKKFINPKAKVVVTSHGGDVYCYENAKGWYIRCLSIVDHWIFCSSKLKSRFEYPTPNYSILCAGYDDETFFVKEDEHSVDKGFDCLMVGAVDTNKGIDRLISVARKLPDLSFAIIGEGKERERFERLAPKNVHFLGAKGKNEISTLLANTKLLLSLSRLESFGLVISEAHACGVPVVATRTDGSQEQIKDTRFLISQENEQELPEMIKEAIDFVWQYRCDNSLNIRRDLVSLAKPYSLTDVSSELINIYKKLLK